MVFNVLLRAAPTSAPCDRDSRRTFQGTAGAGAGRCLLPNLEVKREIIFSVGGNIKVDLYGRPSGAVVERRPQKPTLTGWIQFLSVLGN